MDVFDVRDVVAPASPAPEPAARSLEGHKQELDGIAPGSLVVVRDEEWLVTQVGQTRDGTLVTCQGLSELVAGSSAQFFSELDTITPFDPRQTRVVADSSRNHQKARLWLEATLRKTALPIDDDNLAVTGSM